MSSIVNQFSLKVLKLICAWDSITNMRLECASGDWASSRLEKDSGWGLPSSPTDITVAQPTQSTFLKSQCSSSQFKGLSETNDFSAFVLTWGVNLTPLQFSTIPAFKADVPIVSSTSRQKSPTCADVFQLCCQWLDAFEIHLHKAS